MKIKFYIALRPNLFLALKAEAMLILFKVRLSNEKICESETLPVH